MTEKTACLKNSKLEVYWVDSRGAVVFAVFALLYEKK
jgi:hypothetical protein